MGDVRVHQRVTPVVALLARDAELFQRARIPLEELFGPVDSESPIWPFDLTDYYQDEMGAGLQRQFFSFKRLADPADLPDWKLATNAIEAQFTREAEATGGAARPINLDAGYLFRRKLVLASTKDHAHRLYLRDGIFAEITMSFRDEKWLCHQFTFPDFKSGRYDRFFKRVRSQHLRKLKAEKS
jgi:hypothetical protein